MRREVTTQWLITDPRHELWDHSQRWKSLSNPMGAQRATPLSIFIDMKTYETQNTGRQSVLYPQSSESCRYKTPSDKGVTYFTARDRDQCWGSMSNVTFYQIYRLLSLKIKKKTRRIQRNGNRSITRNLIGRSVTVYFQLPSA